MIKDYIFNYDAETHSEALKYLKLRSVQLLKFNYFIQRVQYTNFGWIAYYDNANTPQDLCTKYVAIYVLKQYRGKGILSNFMKSNPDYKFINLVEMGLLGKMISAADTIPHINVGFEDYHEYRLENLKKHYEDSMYDNWNYYISYTYKVMAVNKWLNFSKICTDSLIILPLLWSDKDFVNNWKTITISSNLAFFISEYKNVSKNYNLDRKIQSTSDIVISPITDVNNLLLSTAIVNYNNYENHYKLTHPRASLFGEYYKNWLVRLSGMNKYEDVRDRLNSINLFDEYKKINDRQLI